jgi:hypothetical protein
VLSDFSADCIEIPQAYLMYGKGFLGNMTENLQADCVQSHQAGFMQCFHNTARSDSAVKNAEVKIR